MSFGFMFEGYSIIADVEEITDAYGTGDSPTLYEVELLQIINDDLDEIDESDMGKFFCNDVTQKAIEVYKEGMR
jgi:hypothetical protein